MPKEFFLLQQFSSNRKLPDWNVSHQRVDHVQLIALELENRVHNRDINLIVLQDCPVLRVLEVWSLHPSSVLNRFEQSCNPRICVGLLHVGKLVPD